MEEVIFNGHAGRIEGRYYKSQRVNAPVALILHPDPNYGGTMNNKVVYSLFKCFHDLGFSVLRFNFRGVGRSQGQFDDGNGELSDATIALDWLQNMNPDAKQCWIAGYSFGAWVGLQLLMRRPDINNFIAVSPPANEKDFTFLAPCPASGLIIQGGADDIVPPSMVAAMARHLNQQRNVEIDFAMIEDADHQYNNHLPDLYKVSGQYVISAMQRREPIRKRRGRRKKSDIGDELLLENEQDYDNECDIETEDAVDTENED
ncbi:MAG: alpha/beta hydrolase [Alphaproteobacteria bacterium]|nr:alpha/beta hydrolase [Alphaproteobacteria bacterium]